MKKEEVPILVGLVLVGFFMLFFLASSVDDLSLTGHAVVGADQPCGGETNDTCTAGLFCENGVCVLEEVCDSDNLNLCIDISGCEGAGGFWYDGACNVGAQPSCSNDLTLCLDETNCTTIGNGFWYDGSCNVDEETCTPDCVGKECDDDGCGGSCGSCASGTCVNNNCEIVDEQEEQEEEEETTETELVVEDTTPVVTGKTVEQIIAEMEAEQEVKTQEEVEDVETEEELEPLGEITGGIVGGEFNESECDGCVYDKKKCYDFNKRKNDSYCTEEGWIVQKEINATCVEDFECLSNSCVEEQCGDYNWIRKFFNWIRDLFIKEIKINENQTIVNESEIIELG